MSDNEVKVLTFIALGLMISFVYLVGLLILHRRKQQNLESTPVTEEGLRRFDDLVPAYAVMLAWTDPGVNPRWHEKAKQEVRKQMPVLARALDRMVD